MHGVVNTLGTEWKYVNHGDAHKSIREKTNYVTGKARC